MADAPGLPDEQLEDFLAGCLAHAPANPSVFYNLACAFIALNRQEDALAAVRAAVQYGAPDLDALREEPLLAPIAGDARFAEAFTAERITTIDHLVVERGGHKLLQPSVGLHLFFDSDVEAAEPVAALIKQLSQELPEMFRSFRPSGAMAMRPITRGKVARDCTALRKRKSAYGVTCQYDSASGEACDLRLFLDLDAEGGELSIHLPLSWSDDPQALFVRLDRELRCHPPRSRTL